MKRSVSLQAAFADQGSVRSALEGLLDWGLSYDQIEVRSSEPLPADLVARLLPERRRIARRVLQAAVAGGVLGGAAAYAIGAHASRAFPLQVGGMPLLSGPPLGIVTYEGTALGVILATVASVFWHARLLQPASAGRLDAAMGEHRYLLTLFDVDGEALELARSLCARHARRTH